MRQTRLRKNEKCNVFCELLIMLVLLAFVFGDVVNFGPLSDPQPVYALVRPVWKTSFEEERRSPVASEMERARLAGIIAAFSNRR